MKQQTTTQTKKWHVINVRPDVYQVIQKIADEYSTRFVKVSAASILDMLLRKELAEQIAKLK